MKKDDFLALFKYNTGVPLTETLGLSRDFILFDFENHTVTKFESFEDLMEKRPDVKKIIDEAEEFYWYY